MRLGKRRTTEGKPGPGSPLSGGAGGVGYRDSDAVFRIPEARRAGPAVREINVFLYYVIPDFQRNRAFESVFYRSWTL